jgi:hypothetical protein
MQGKCDIIKISTELNLNKDLEMIRYIWNSKDTSGKIIYSDSSFPKEGKINVPTSGQPIFVNILERLQDGLCYRFHVKLFYSNGDILEGWTSSFNLPIHLLNSEELLDGRFNK